MRHSFQADCGAVFQDVRTTALIDAFQHHLAVKRFSSWLPGPLSKPAVPQQVLQGLVGDFFDQTPASISSARRRNSKNE
jgi:hypothetical protein